MTKESDKRKREARAQHQMKQARLRRETLQQQSNDLTSSFPCQGIFAKDVQTGIWTGSCTAQYCRFPLLMGRKGGSVNILPQDAPHIMFRRVSDLQGYFKTMCEALPPQNPTQK